ncbi:MAG: hypothetical protein WBC02_07440, partial [Candidatus Aminicenantaceae bacterium]
VPPEFVDTKDEDTFVMPSELDEEESAKEEEKLKEEEEIPEIEPYIPDIDVGLPEKMEEEAAPIQKKAKVKKRRLKKRHFSKLSMWLKPRAFDLLSIAVFWLISLWLASRVMEVSLFQLLSVSALPALVFYVILLVVYYTFFLLFLGETLGDHFFPQE